MNQRNRLLAGLVGASTLLFASSAFAEGSAKNFAKGFHLGSGPQLLIPTDGGPMGGGLDIEARYGIAGGDHFVVAPGIRASGYIISEQGVALITPIVKFSFPVGPVGPYLFAGAGPGFRSELLAPISDKDPNYKNTGFAFIGGVGMMFHLGKIVAIGVEGAFEKIFDTDFQVIALKPVIEFGFF